jgi:hypothetical protein
VATQIDPNPPNDVEPTRDSIKHETMSPEGSGAASPRGQRGGRGHLLAEHRGILELGESRHVRPRVARRSAAGCSLFSGKLAEIWALRAGGGRGTERRPVGALCCDVSVRRGPVGVVSLSDMACVRWPG